MKQEKSKKKWDNADITYLRLNYNRISIQEISKNLNRSIFAIRYMAVNQGLTEKLEYWNKKDLTYLAINYTTLSLSDISLHLGRSISATRKKAGLLNLSKNLSKTNIDLPIEKKIPFFKGKTAEFMQILYNMEIGDSFVYPNNDRQTILNCVNKFPEKIYRSKDIDGVTRRIWRLL